MAARINTVADAVVARIVALWTPTHPDTCERCYFWKPAERELKDLAGRHVRVFPVTYGDQPETRSENRHEFRFLIVVAERYPDAGVPPRAWMDERAEFVQDKLIDGLDYDGQSRLEASATMKLLTGEVGFEVYDVEYADKRHLFWCEIEIMFWGIF